MKFVYPLELSVGNDAIAIQDDEGKVTYELVTATYRQADKVVVETVAYHLEGNTVVETGRQMLRLDPGLKVQTESRLYQTRPGRPYAHRDK